MMEAFLMVVSVSVATLGILIAYRLYIGKPETAQTLTERYQRAYVTLFNKYYVDELYQAVVVGPLNRVAGALYRFVDVSAIDGAVNGAGKFCLRASESVRRLQTGFVHHYALSVLAGAVLLVGYVVLR